MLKKSIPGLHRLFFQQPAEGAPRGRRDDGTKAFSISLRLMPTTTLDNYEKQFASIGPETARNTVQWLKAENLRRCLASKTSLSGNCLPGTLDDSRLVVRVELLLTMVRPSNFQRPPRVPGMSLMPTACGSSAMEEQWRENG